jgi:hypothetical protein
MLGTTFQWWRAFLYLGILTTFRAYIAAYIEPWVNQANDLIGAKIKPEDAALFICVPLLMGAIIKADEVLASLITIILRELILPLIILAWLSIVALAIVQQNGTCAPFNTFWDVVSCSPLALQWASDFAKPFLDRAVPWVQSVHWISWMVWSIAWAPIFIVGTAIALLGAVIALLLFFLALLVLAVSVERASEIIRRSFRYIDRRRNPDKYIRPADLAGGPLCIDCDKCGQHSQYYLDGFYGPYAKISDWLTRDCPRKRAKRFSGKTDDACGARWWVPEPKRQAALIDAK